MEIASSRVKVPVLLDKINKIECKLLQDNNSDNYVTPAIITRYNSKSSENIIDENENLKSYAEFDNTHAPIDKSIYTVTNESKAEDIMSAEVCQINSAEGLKQFEMISGDCNFSSENLTVTLSSDIDMSDCMMWAGIRRFQGTFDGNGYVISNLKGIQGLFANTTSATIKNVGLENLDIKGRLSYTGGLIGYAKTTNIYNCYVTGNVVSTTTSSIDDIASDNKIYSCGTGGLIGLLYIEKGNSVKYDNVYSLANVEGNDAVGGLVGASMAEHAETIACISNAYATGTVTGRNGIGGFAGIIYGGENNPNYYTSANNCYAGGNVTGVTNVGGFLGMYLCFDDRAYTGYRIENCNSSGNVTGSDSNVGAFAGHIYIKTKHRKSRNYNFITFKNCGYSGNEKYSKTFGNITDEEVINY